MSGFYNQPFKRKSTSLTTLVIALVVVLGLVLGIRAYIVDTIEDTAEIASNDNKTSDTQTENIVEPNENYVQNVNQADNDNLENNSVASPDLNKKTNIDINSNPKEKTTSSVNTNTVAENKAPKKTREKHYSASTNFKRKEITPPSAIKQSKVKSNETFNQFNRLTKEEKNYNKTTVKAQITVTSTKKQENNTRKETPSIKVKVTNKPVKIVDKPSVTEKKVEEVKEAANIKTIDEIVRTTKVKKKEEINLSVVDKDYETKHAFNNNVKKAVNQKRLNDAHILTNKKGSKTKAVKPEHLGTIVSPVNRNSFNRKVLREQIITSEITALDNQKKKERVK